MGRFVTPDTVRLALSGDDWIEIKSMLGIGDQKRIETAGLKRFSKKDGESVDVDFAEFSLARTAAYLLDWSFKGADDRVVPLSRSAIEALTPETYKEIENAITKHVEGLQGPKQKPAGV